MNGKKMMIRNEVNNVNDFSEKKLKCKRTLSISKLDERLFCQKIPPKKA